VTFFVGGAAASHQAKAAEWSDLLKMVKTMGPQYAQSKEHSTNVNAMGRPKPLRTLVDNVFERIEGTEPDTKELNDKNYPGGWLERSVEVSFRSIDLPGIVEFLKEVEKNRRQFRIAITKLDIKKHRREEGKYRVNMTIATYEKTEPVMGRKNKKRMLKGGHK
jgi:glycerophosphoryl diester phosphodiesterase